MEVRVRRLNRCSRRASSASTPGAQPAAGEVTSIGGVDRERFDLRARVRWTALLAPGSYLQRMRTDGGWSAGRMFAVDGVTTVELDLR
jgi:hypothetical protein